MAIHFTFRKLEATESLKNHIIEKVDKFGKFVTYPLEIHVNLSVEKEQQICEITVHAEHKEMVAESKTTDLYESIDMAVHKIESQLKKEREKRKGHSSAHLAARPSKAAKLARDVDADIPHLAKTVTKKTTVS